ncbi:MAG: fumarylacetoacetate hydrolase family protein, partial [bacterium]
GLRGAWSFQPPINRPQKVLCIGRNYKAHAEELGNKPPQEPLFFSKAPSSIIAHDETIRVPNGVGRVDFEGELAIVISKKGSHIPVSKAFEFVAGYSILNDVTARDLQKSDIEARRPWFRSKSFDTFCPFGQFLVSTESIGNYRDLTLQLSLNGEVRQKALVSDMIFSIEEIVSYISKFCTLMPGDVIATGTPAGVAPMRAGDTVEIEVTHIGTLKNAVA